MLYDYNLQALKIAYLQFFKNMHEFSDTIFVNLHINLLNLIDDNEVIFWTDIKLVDYVIKDEYEDLKPREIINLLLDLYSNIVSTFNLEDNIIVNKKYLIDYLAEQEVISEFQFERKENHIYIDDNGIEHFQEDALSYYNHMQEYYTNVIENLEL